MNLVNTIAELMLPTTTKLVVNDPSVTALLEPKQVLEQVYSAFIENPSGCEQVLDYLGSKEEKATFETVVMQKQQNRIVITIGGQTSHYDLSLFQQMMEKLRIFAIRLLPIGSAIRLSGISQNEEENPIFIITERFVIPEMMEGGYFDYTGILYPLGSINSEKRIMFGHHRIQEVLKRGYEDELDLECQTYIKEILLHQKELMSIDLRNMFFLEQYERMNTRGERRGF